MTKKFRDFLKLIRLNQAIAIWLLLLPCFMAIILIFKDDKNIDIFNYIKTTILFTIGGFFARSAGCIINDLIDYKIDRKVSRTKDRPIASGKIKISSTIIYLTILLIFCLIILLQFNTKTIFSGFVVIFLIACYPLMKRFTYFPQIFLGITFNFGIIMASFALTQSVDGKIIILYLATIIWTFFYDTLYAFQDLNDDIKIGVKSSAIYLAKNNPKKSLSKISLIINLLFIMLGVVQEFNLNYYLAIALCQIIMLLQIHKCDLKSSEDCLKFFKFNWVFGLIYLFAIIIG